MEKLNQIIKEDHVKDNIMELIKYGTNKGREESEEEGADKAPSFEKEDEEEF